jgi:hypothetical protein
MISPPPHAGDIYILLPHLVLTPPRTISSPLWSTSHLRLLTGSSFDYIKIKVNFYVIVFERAIERRPSTK